MIADQNEEAYMSSDVPTTCILMASCADHRMLMCNTQLEFRHHPQHDKRHARTQQTRSPRTQDKLSYIVVVSAERLSGLPADANSNSGQFYRSIQRLPGTGKHAVVLGLQLGSGRSQSFSVVRPNTGRQLRPVQSTLFLSRCKSQTILGSQLPSLALRNPHPVRLTSEIRVKCQAVHVRLPLALDFPPSAECTHQMMGMPAVTFTH